MIKTIKHHPIHPLAINPPMLLSISIHYIRFISMIFHESENPPNYGITINHLLMIQLINDFHPLISSK